MIGLVALGQVPTALEVVGIALVIVALVIDSRVCRPRGDVPGYFGADCRGILEV